VRVGNVHWMILPAPWRILTKLIPVTIVNGGKTVVGAVINAGLSGPRDHKLAASIINSVVESDAFGELRARFLSL
jgi:hypothetical protein